MTQYQPDFRILAIGNSFSQDATAYLHQIAKTEQASLEVVNLFVGGCSLEQHWKNVQTNQKAYSYELNGGVTGKFVSIQEALTEGNWDYVTLQQVSYLSMDEHTYQPYLKNLSEVVQKYAPGAEQVIHQTWAYEQGSDKLRQTGFQDQREMFDHLKSAYAKAAASLGNLRVIPCGTAFQLALKKNIHLHRDTFHASIPEGRYLLGSVWYRFFTGKVISDDSYCPEGLSEEKKKVLNNLVNEITL